ncbi:FecR family protein [Larkinella ripae]
MNQFVSKHTLFSYLAGQATPLERQRVEEWLKNPANTETFHVWLLEWETRSLQFTPDPEAAFAKLTHRLDQPETPNAADESAPAPKPLLRLWNWKPYLMAATVLLTLGLLTIFLKNRLLYQTYQTVSAQEQTIRLEDGTDVKLKANSALHVPRFGFQNDVREVLLTGEASFSVTHKQNHQRFVVKTSDQFQVEVLGTEFTVYARKRGTKVVLDRGKIRVDYKTATKKQQLIMKPGEVVMLSQRGTIQLRKLAPVRMLAEEEEHLFLFRDTSLWEACYLIGEHFGKKVEIADDSLAHRTISGNFRVRTADDLLELLTATSSLHIDSTGNTLLLKDN